MLLRIVMVIIGVVLIAWGIHTLIYNQISLTQQEQIVDVLAIRDTTQGKLPAIFGALAIIAGGILVLVQLLKRGK